MPEATRQEVEYQSDPPLMMNECTTITTISGGWQATSRPVVLCVGYVSSSQPSTSCISHFMCLHLMGQRLPTLAMMGCQFSTTTTTTLAGRSASFSGYWHLDRNQPGHLHSLRRRVPFILPSYSPRIQTPRRIYVHSNTPSLNHRSIGALPPCMR